MTPHATIIPLLIWFRAAWGKANKVFNKDILFLSDPLATFSKSIGWSNGVQANRYAILLNQGVVLYAGKDERGQIIVRSIQVISDWFGIKLTTHSKCRILQHRLF